MKRAILLGVLAVVGVTSTASADTIWGRKVAGWEAGAYSRSGKFSHCAASVPYRSGILLLFSINQQLQWSMALINPAWNLTKGNQYPIQYNVDLDEPLSTEATAISSHGVEAYLTSTMTLFNSFRAGKTLYIHSERGSFQFNLTNSSKVLAVLLECAKGKGTEPPVAVANPFVPQAPEKAPQPSADRSAQREEAMLIAANLVSAMGITGFTFLKPADIPNTMAADAAWKSAAGLGGVTVLLGTADAASIASSIIGYEAKGCKGKFASGSSPADGPENLPAAFTKCATGKEVVIAYYIIAPRAAGGSIVVSTYTLDQPANDQSSSELRSAVFKALPK